MKRSVFAVLVAVLVLCVPMSAWGISYGEPDNGEHPYVGSAVALVRDPETGATRLVQLCSGTLIDTDVVLTAAHCLVGLEQFGVERVFYTFDEVIDADRDGVVDAGVRLLTGRRVPHPLFGVGGQSNPHDVGVFLLDRPVTGVAPARLANLGLLDDPGLRGETFTAVGYGTVRETNRKGFQSILVGWRREKADQTLQTVTRAWAQFSMNLATGNGGGCYGDSGGPHLLGDVVVSVTVTGDAVCKATDKTYRVDTPWARAFLRQYVPLS